MSRNGHRLDENVFDQNEARNIGGVSAADPTLQARKGRRHLGLLARLLQLLLAFLQLLLCTLRGLSLLLKHIFDFDDVLYYDTEGALQQTGCIAHVRIERASNGEQSMPIESVGCPKLTNGCTFVSFGSFWLDLDPPAD